MLIKQLGTDANDILEQKTEDSISDTNRLSVPLLRKEMPSATETSDLTSLCSLSSQAENASLNRTESQKYFIFLHPLRYQKRNKLQEEKITSSSSRRNVA